MTLAAILMLIISAKQCKDKDFQNVMTIIFLGGLILEVIFNWS